MAHTHNQKTQQGAPSARAEGIRGGGRAEIAIIYSGLQLNLLRVEMLGIKFL